MGSYIEFINSMLGLRSQKLEEEKLKAQQEQENLAAITSSISNLGKSVGGAVSAYNQGQTQMKQDTLANQMMGEYYGTPPRAEAVVPGTTTLDPAMQKTADTAASSMPGFYTGGEEELKMRMGMESAANTNITNAVKLKQKEDYYKFLKSKQVTTEAQKATAKIDKDTQQAYDNEKWFIKENHAIDDALANADDPQKYQAAVDAKIALNQAAITRGMKKEPIAPESIAPYMTPAEKASLGTQQAQVELARKDLEAARTAPPGLIDTARSWLGLGTGSGALGLPAIPTQKESATQTAQQKYEESLKSLREMPGGSFYDTKPVPSTDTKSKTASTATTTTGGDTIPLETGTRRFSPSTKKLQEWDGSKWVDI